MKAEVLFNHFQSYLSYCQKLISQGHAMLQDEAYNIEVPR